MRYPFFLGLLLSSALACDGTTGPEGCDVCTTSAVVFGTVVTSGGDPVVGAPMDVRAFDSTCDAEFPNGGTDGLLPKTDEQGRYRAQPFSLSGPFTARCFRVTVNPEASVEGIPVDTVETMGVVEFRSDFTGGARDSLRIDVVVGQ